MKIFDLTRDRHPRLFSPLIAYDGLESYSIHVSSLMEHLWCTNRSINEIINETPIYLVDSSMAGEYVSVPGADCLLRIPEDKFLGTEDNEFDIEGWLRSKEDEISGKKDDYKERVPQKYSVFDYLGIYVSNRTCPIPRSIFVWMDKIENIGDNYDKSIGCKNKSAAALFDLVLYHELGHAIMDVEALGLSPSPFFTYQNDNVYRFIEEAYANAIALAAVHSQLDSSQKTFVEHFVKGQGCGYADGWELFCNTHGNLDMLDIEQWLSIKVLFNYDVAVLMSNRLKHWSHLNLFGTHFMVEAVGRKGWLAVRDRREQWGLTDIHTLRLVPGFKKYDSFWSFDDDGLCMVRLNQESGDLYGFVNLKGEEQIPVEYDDIYSFENGITVAKRHGCYGIIGDNNNIVVPFSMTYPDVRSLRNGYATMKDASGKWGAIDSCGQVVIPCEYDSLIVFDQNGIARVKKDGEEFMIDTNGNRVD